MHEMEAELIDKTGARFESPSIVVFTAARNSSAAMGIVAPYWLCGISARPHPKMDAQPESERENKRMGVCPAGQWVVEKLAAVVSMGSMRGARFPEAFDLCSRKRDLRSSALVPIRPM